MSETKKRLYISGGITGVPNYRERFAAAEYFLEFMGFEGVSPVLNFMPECDGSCVETPTNPRSNGHVWTCWLRADLIGMLQCDGVITLPEWEKSRGAVLEVTTAFNVGMEVQSLSERDLTWAILKKRRVDDGTDHSDPLHNWSSR